MKVTRSFVFLLFILLLIAFAAPLASASPLQQGAITYGQTVNGTVPNNGVQTWTFAGTTGDVVTINVTATTNWDPYLRLRDPVGTQVAENDDAVLGVNLNPTITYSLVSTGTFTIDVRPYAGESGPTSLDGIGGSYTLTLQSSTSTGSAAVTGTAAACPPNPATAVTADGVLVYAQANASSPLLAVLSIGSTVQVLDANPVNGFVRVRLSNCAEGFAQLDAVGTPVVAPDQGGGTPVSTVVVEARGNVRIRETPSINGSRLGLIGWGEQAFLLSEDPSGNWYQINFEGLVGWVASDWFIVVSGNDANIVVSTGDGTVVNGVGGGGTLVQAVGNVLIRETPSINGRRLDLVPWGDTAILLDTDNSGNWYNVDYNGLVGWTASGWWRTVGGEAAGDVAIDTDDDGEPDAFVDPEVATPEAEQVVNTIGELPPSVGVTLTAIGNVRVRGAPSINGERLGFLAWGTAVDARARDADNNWLLVVADGVVGWVARDWLQVETGNPATLPISQ